MKGIAQRWVLRLEGSPLSIEHTLMQSNDNESEIRGSPLEFPNVQWCDNEYYGLTMSSMVVAGAYVAYGASAISGDYFNPAVIELMA